jgi:hypothetical protein
MNNVIHISADLSRCEFLLTLFSFPNSLLSSNFQLNIVDGSDSWIFCIQRFYFVWFVFFRLIGILECVMIGDVREECAAMNPSVNPFCSPLPSTFHRVRSRERYSSPPTCETLCQRTMNNLMMRNSSSPHLFN